MSFQFWWFTSQLPIYQNLPVLMIYKSRLLTARVHVWFELSDHQNVLFYMFVFHLWVAPSCNAAWGCSSHVNKLSVFVLFYFSCIHLSFFLFCFFLSHFLVGISEKEISLWVIAESSTDQSMMGKALSLGVCFSGCAQTRGRVWSTGLIGHESVSALVMQINHKMHDSLSTWNLV